jgi:hypothetical protein
MSVIENFAALSFEEQKKFAEALLKTINSESIFSSDTDFEITGIVTDDTTGELVILVENTTPVEVTRQAVWASDSEENAEEIGADVDYDNYLLTDAKKAFNTLDTVIDGYRVSLEISDIDEGEVAEVNVNKISHEDSGIGDYEYFGFTGTDSQPYVEVEGTIVTKCECQLAITVAPEDNIEIEPDEI